MVGIVPSPLRRSTIVAIVFAAGVARMALAQDPALFERVLVPVSVTFVPGAYGSLWSTELYYRNNSDRPVAVFPLRVSDSVPSIRRTERLLIFALPAHAPGQFLYFDRDGGDEVQFDLRLFNRSDPRAAWGTKLPVVRDAEFAPEVSLINVPTGSDFRSALRIYALPEALPIDDLVRVRIYTHDERLLADTVLRLQGLPKYAQILSLADVFPEIRDVERVRVHVEANAGEAKLWAFVSVTANATQQVSLVTP
ncbi:MAG TPA: hypothetical protein VEO54_24650 [Thermoanaerobaculia bacterium]|nr:hypothetical protein [Thermoanaerobaculia bacterium]